MVWTEGGQPHSALWRSESGLPAPADVVAGDDRLSADAAYRLAEAGTAILWRGDYHNGRLLVDALARRVDRRLGSREVRANASRRSRPATPLDAWHAYRRRQAERARMLAMVVLPFEPGHVLPLRRAPDVREACLEAYGPGDAPYVAPLRELLGIIGAHEWRKKGVVVPALDARIHPHYGVFSPIRGEYVDLVARAPFARAAPGRSGTAPASAFDVGTGTGVLAAVLARRGVARVVATDNDSRAIACARDNIARLHLTDRIEIVDADLFPPGRAPLIVCNPPWIPGHPAATIERAIFDPDSRMLKGFIDGVSAHLEAGGEAWLILSDFAERLGLRTRAEWLDRVGAAGLRVVDRLDAAPRHPKAADTADPLHAVRAAEVVSLWRLAARRTSA